MRHRKPNSPDHPWTVQKRMEKKTMAIIRRGAPPPMKADKSIWPG